jgi:1-acyl-sn-glycerol-3-phosphate acyltransferase
LSEEQAGRIATVGELMRLVEGKAAATVDATDWPRILSNPLTGEQVAATDRYFHPAGFFVSLLFALSRLSRLVLEAIFGFKVVGAEKLPKAGAFLICANHVSFLDACVLACAAPRDVFPRMFYFGASKYMRSRSARLLARRLRVVGVDPDANLGTALRIGREGLARGFVLCVFPEGHRSVDGLLRPFRKGPAILAVETKSPIAPAAVIGAHEVWARGSSRIRIRPLEVRFGDPISPTDESYETLTARAQDAVAGLLKPPEPP